MDKEVLARLPAYLKSWLQYNYQLSDTPGFVVAVSSKDKLILNEAFGYADLEKKLRMTPQHLFRIASHSKTFTATAVMQLQDQGKLRIDDRIADYLSWLKQHKDKRVLKITIRQLLSNSAGVIRDGINADYWNVEKPFPNQESFKSEILESELVIENNTRLKYSNYGFTLLGMLVAEVSGLAYNEYVKQSIINPLDLPNTGPEYDPALEDKYVTGYTRLDKNKKRLPITHIDTHAMSAATGFYSTAADLCKYFSAHIAGSGKLLDDESKKEMQRPHWQAEHTKTNEGYCLGLDYEYVNDRRMLGHGGGFPGNITKSYFDPKDGLVVVVLTNANNSWAGYIDRSIVKVIDYFIKNNQKPKWQKYEGRYSDLWWDADVIAINDKLIVTDSGGWEPFDNPTELEHVSQNQFKISKTDSWSSVDETVEFTMTDSGKVEAMTYAGSTMLPEKIYQKYWQSKKRIG